MKAQSDIIDINEHLHIRMRENGGLFIAQYMNGRLDAILLDKDELNAILSYYERD